jgi:hypothetical protein
MIFLAFVAGMVGAAYYGYTNGDPYKLITPIDQDGRLCGINTDVLNFPYLYYDQDDYRVVMCVSECPKA